MSNLGSRRSSSDETVVNSRQSSTLSVRQQSSASAETAVPDKGKAAQDQEQIGATAIAEQLKQQEREKTENDRSGAGTSSRDLEKGKSTEEVIDWDGPDDTYNPQNWPMRKKWAATTVVSLFTFMSPFASTFISVPSRQLVPLYGIQSVVELELCTSIFLLAYALGPLVIGPLSEIFGRVPVLQLANAWFMVFNFVTAWAPNKEAFIIFRFLAGLGGSAPLSIGGGVIGDVWRKEERGQAVAIYSLCPLLAPSFGPLLGAFVDEYSTWRWVFWSSTIAMVAIQALGLFYLEESYAPVLLEQKAKKIFKDTGTLVRTKYQTGDRHWQAIIRKGLTRPFYLFAHEPIIQVFAVIQMLVYGQIYLILVTVDSTFIQVYGWSTAIAGLVYIAMGIGITGMSQGQGRTMDRVYGYFTNKNGGKGKPEYRLVFLFPTGIILPVGYLIYGWTAQYHQFWLAPCIGLALIGAGMIGFFQPSQLYVIDCFTLHAASALAAVTCLRSICGFAFPLFANQMFQKLGLGGGSSLLAGLSFLIGVPTPFFLWKYGERIRLASKHAQA